MPLLSETNFKQSNNMKLLLNLIVLNVYVTNTKFFNNKITIKNEISQTISQCEIKISNMQNVSRRLNWFLSSKNLIDSPDFSLASILDEISANYTFMIKYSTMLIIALPPNLQILDIDRRLKSLCSVISGYYPRNLF